MEDFNKKQPLKINFEWLARDQGDSIERATFAALEILIGANNATEVEDLTAKTIRGSIRVSAHQLAIWFAMNWWRLRWQPAAIDHSWKMSHKIGAAGGGYAWPDLTFISDGITIWAHCRQTTAINADPVRFLSSFDAPVSAEDFERGMDLFMDAVIEREASLATEWRLLPEMWAEIIEERRTPEMAEWRKLEAMLGFDPDEGSAEMIERLLREKTWAGSDAIEEVAAAAGSEAIDLIADLQGEAKSKALAVTIPDYGWLRSELQSKIDSSQLPWQQAEKAAGIARGKWRLPPGPVSNPVLADLFDFSASAIPEVMEGHSAALSAGFRENGDGRFRVCFSKRYPTGVRFALSRIVADHLYADRSDRLLPATAARTARQKFQRAFAQEFLCPFEDLNAFLDGRMPTDELIEEAAAHFDVSPLLTRTVMVNRGLLARDELER